MTLLYSLRASIRRTIHTGSAAVLLASTMPVLHPDMANAQPGTTYSFSQSTGTYSQITGGTVLVSGTNWNNQLFTVSLPAPFWFDGVWYSTMYVTANGFITFGSTMAGNNYTPLSGNAGYAGAISPLGANLQDANVASSAIRWQQVGNEVVVQWREAQRKIGGNGESFSFQARLNTSNGVIKFVYSAVTSLDNSTQKQPEVGLRGASNSFPAQVKNRSVGNGTETWSTSLNGTANNSVMRFTGANPSKAPVSGLTYTFTPPCVTANSSVTSPIACNGGNGAITVTGTSSATPYVGTGVFTRAAGTYSFTVTDAFGCSASTNITITQPAVLSASAVVTTPVACNGGNANVTVSASGGTAPYTGTGTFVRAAGTYTFTVTDASGCSTTANVTVTQPTALSASAAVITPIACNGGNGNVTVSASGGTAPYTGIGPFARAAGNYTFTVTDAGGCSTSANVSLTQPMALTASASVTSPVACHGGTALVGVSASGGTAPHSGTGTVIRAAGSYLFSVSDANGCTAATSLTISQPAVLFASASLTSLETSCAASDAVVSVTATGGSAPYSGTGTHIGLTAGSPVFTVNDANNCTTTAGLTIPEADSDADGTMDCGDECPYDPLKTTTGQCGCGTPETDTDGDGTPDCSDGCPADPAKSDPGSCGCGAAETDTDGDTYADCVDGCPSDPIKISPGTCGCGQADSDTDGDGTPDCLDACPNGPQPGSPCDDGDVLTTNDIVGNDCVCQGTPAQDELSLTLTTDDHGDQTSWEIVPLAGGPAVCSGSALPSNTIVSFSCQITNGEYQMRVMDSAGDGICCGSGTGGFTLNAPDGRRIIDASEGAVFGSLSCVLPGFSLPLGADGLTPSRCDREDLLPDDFIQAIPNDDVRAQYGDNNHNSGYQFWIFDPNGGYSRRILVTHSTSSYIFPSGEDRCSYLRLSQVVTDPIPHNRTLNVRVRSLVNGTYNAFGPACRLRIDVAGSCPVTQLVADANDPHHSCGISNVMLDGSRWLYAVPVSQATTYQFEFTSGNYLRNVTSSGSGLLLTEWDQSPLEYGMKHYNVRVRVSYDNGANWCPFGPSCGITTANSAPSQPRSATIVGSDPASLRVWPNPLREGDLNVLLSGLREDETSAQLTMIDLQGREIADQRVAAQHGMLNIQLTADEELPTGTYLITIRTTSRAWTERVVVE